MRVVTALKTRVPPPVRRLGRRLARRTPGRRLPTAPFATFRRDDGSELELLTGYRDLVKGGWRAVFWQTQLLLELGERGRLAPDAEELRQRLLHAHTLPVPLAEIEELVRREAAAHPRDVREGDGILAIAPAGERVEALAAYYEATARSLVATLARHGIARDGARILDVGCGSGYLTFALGATGVADACGIDTELGGVTAVAERQAVRAALGAGRSRLEQADATALPYPDASFDAAVSFSAVEHLADVEAVFRELARVVRPGGVMIHVVDPWFSPQGGHSLCTLDAPWAHIRVAEPELARYLREVRPHEAEAALSFYRDGFQRPRRTSGELRRLIEHAGFDVVEWEERRDAYRNHRPLVTRELVAECAALHPSIAPQDLTTSTIRAVVRRHGD